MRVLLVMISRVPWDESSTGNDFQGPPRDEGSTGAVSIGTI